MDSDKLQATTYMSRNFYLLAIGIYLPAKKGVLSAQSDSSKKLCLH